jgi:hypothetical protein
MVRSGAPKRLWDDCLVREAYVRSSTALDIFSLEGQVPDIIVKGQTFDISPLAEYAWYEWVKFWDTGQSFPDSKEGLGRDLGPAIDIGPAMSRKVLKLDGEVMFRVSVRGLALDEMQSPCMPHEGHLDAVYHLFEYLSLHHNARVVSKLDVTPRYQLPEMRGQVLIWHYHDNKNFAVSNFGYRSLPQTTARDRTGPHRRRVIYDNID